MKIKTSELTDAALDWAVATCEGRGCEFEDPRDPWLTRNGIADQPLHSYTPSTDWAQGGPITELEGVTTAAPLQPGDLWGAWKWIESRDSYKQYGLTPLIAAMRCFVASRLGDEVDIPDELC